MIEITGLYKSFGTTSVLRGVELAMRPGRVTALIGPNGAGKTTLIKCILGLTRASAGEIRVGGNLVADNPSYRADIGYMPQIARFPENLSASDLIAMLVDLREPTPDHPVVARDEELLELFQLESHLHKPLRVLSGGTRQKVNAVLAFLFHPTLVVLDEPSAGLDPVASSILKDKILRERTAGSTVLLTSHIMSEVDELAEDVVCLLDGEVRYAGAVPDLKAMTQQVTLERAIASIIQEVAA